MQIIPIETQSDFKNLAQRIQDKANYKIPIAFGIARLDYGQSNTEKKLQANYLTVNYNENINAAAVFLYILESLGYRIDFEQTELSFNINGEFLSQAFKVFKPFLANASFEHHINVYALLQIKRYAKEVGIYRDDLFKITFIFDDKKPQSLEVVYLKLYLLSLRKVPLRQTNLEDIFTLLPTVAWSNNKPIDLDYLRQNQIYFKCNTNLAPKIDFIDKIPRFLAHVIPDDSIRILDASKVRMGASIASGTTIMPGASYINFNAGTKGASMIEGRISSSAVVDDGSDVGGGASILGVLSGTDGNPISIGKNCLLGANSVTGIPLGDACIVDAGIAVLEGTKFTILPTEQEKIKTLNEDFELKNSGLYKGKELMNLNGLHFRLDSKEGKMLVFRSNRIIKLNTDLHQD